MVSAVQHVVHVHGRACHAHAVGFCSSRLSAVQGAAVAQRLHVKSPQCNMQGNAHVCTSDLTTTADAGQGTPVVFMWGCVVEQHEPFAQHHCTAHVNLPRS